MTDSSAQITLVHIDESTDWIDPARAILREYGDSLKIDLAFQNFEAELATLPGDYAAPGGQLLLALIGGSVAGCAAFRALTDVDYANACEMKRLYVRPAFRRFGLGRVLIGPFLLKLLINLATILLNSLENKEE